MKAQGFTLLEMVLTLAILGVVGMILAPGLKSVIDGYAMVSFRRHAAVEANAGLGRMVREITLIPGSPQINTIGAQQFTFEYPISTTITYSLNAGDLVRNSDILVENVSALAFTYYDESGTSTAIAADVRSVGILFTVDIAGDVPDLTLRTRVFLLNAGNEYVDFSSP